MGDLASRLAFHSTRMPNGCLEWTASRTSAGYGLVKAHGKTRLAHRVAWELAHSQIPPGLLVCHACDNPACVDVEHLFLGTAHDNVRDKMAKGRFRPVLGEAHGMAKLSGEQVTEIRELVRAGNVTKAEIARRFGVSPTQITRLTNGRAWRSFP